MNREGSFNKGSFKVKDVVTVCKSVTYNMCNVDIVLSINIDVCTVYILCRCFHICAFRILLTSHLVKKILKLIRKPCDFALCFGCSRILNIYPNMMFSHIYIFQTRWSIVS